jgi:hypothetical protein
MCEPGEPWDGDERGHGVVEHCAGIDDEHGAGIDDELDHCDEHDLATGGNDYLSTAAT